MARQTLDQWIRDAILDDTKDGKCTAMTLVHIANQNERELHTIKFGGRAWEPKELASLFRGKAEAYAADIVGAQTFNVLAFYADRSEAQNRKPFIVQGEHDMSHTTEPPTKEGQLMQGMRHMEAVMQMAFTQTRMLFESSNAMLTILATQNAKLASENRDAFEIVKDMMIKQVERDDERIMKRLTYQRQTEERSHWMSLVPALVNSFVGKEIIPQNLSDSKLIDAMIESLTEEDIGQLSQIIRPEIWAPLAGRMKDALQRKRLKEEQRAMLANGAIPEVSH